MVIPVVVEMRVAGVIERTAKAVVEVETAMRPRRDTGEFLLKSLISGCRQERSQSTRFAHLFCAHGPFRDLSVTALRSAGSNEVDFFS